MSSWLRWRGHADRLIAAVLGVVLSPIIAALTAAVRHDTPGRGLIGLERVGQGGRTFRMWKIRTMTADATAGLPITMHGDARVTRVGGLLRSSRLDELPQLWNVARGQMALLGPRPEDPAFVADTPIWREMLQARPGVAGPTQLVVADLEASSVTSAERYACEILPVKLMIDAWYVRHASPSLDILIVGCLLHRIAFGRTPSRLHRRIEAAIPEAEVFNVG